MNTVLLHSLILNHIQHFHANGTSEWIPAKRIEMECLAHLTGNLFCRHNRRHREPIPNTLGHCHNIRFDPVRLKTPKMTATTAKTRLDFIGNANATMSTDSLIDTAQITIRVFIGAADTLERFGPETGETGARAKIDL